jgi:hypothetical protein
LLEKEANMPGRKISLEDTLDELDDVIEKLKDAREGATPAQRRRLNLKIRGLRKCRTCLLGYCFDLGIAATVRRRK